ncbi:progesterone-induced-blocking factor 1-like [Pomacea canaliculata]|uniref:progesterone-induced-blocking factor 1-like n=1 Tax=Pomacea canaliculata TaxID=400727 RepID=UPI000D72C631|nr:progesterone-induced-blocking factor 1-like [Pomacea canaliculata]
MAAKDLSKTFEDVESDDPSLETSVPTDLTLSPDYSEREGGRNKKRQITKQLIERKQLVHDMQLLRIELSQKNMTIENMKVEHLQRVEELEEKLQDVSHQKQILQARLESELQIQQEEAKRRQHSINKELESVRSRQQQLEAANERLREKAGDVRRSLRDLSLTEEKYYILRGLPDEEISLRDFVAMRLYEGMRPLQVEIDQLRVTCKSQEEELKTMSSELLELQKKLEEERLAHGELRVRYQKITLEYADSKTRIRNDDYKVENYDKVKLERDNLERDHGDVERQLSVLEIAHNNLQKERDDLSRELSAAKQSLQLLKQDKDYLSRQVTEANNRSTFADEKLQQLARQVDAAKEAREEMYEKYVASRDQYKSEYENKLREELEQIRIRTNTEIDRLRTSTREMYERENRNLREARDMAINEREQAQATERETKAKYEQMVDKFREMQSKWESQLSEVHNQLKVKGFEAERSQLVYEEAMKNLRASEMDIDKLAEKGQVLTKEYYALQTAMEKRVVELEGQLSERNAKLETYERLEGELDDVILQAAEIDNEQEAEKVLFSYGYGANVPSTTKRRMQHSVQLARRVLQLEKANTSLRHEVQREQNKVKQLGDELKSANAVLDQAQQPYSYLIESIRVREVQIQQLSQQVAMLEEDTQKLEKERSDLVKMKNQMALDLERLLNQREEMAIMKQVVMSMSERVPSAKQVGDERRPKSASLHLPSTHHRDFEIHDDIDIVKPGPLSLTKAPRWANKLKKKNSSQKTQFSKVYGYATK